MRRRSPWSTLTSAVVVIGFAIWSFLTAYAPSDTTPLSDVSGPLLDAATTWVHHHAKGGGWDSPVVTLSLEGGQAIRFVGHDRGDAPAAEPVGALQRGTALTARVDATGEIWELSAAGQPVVSLADTLARHHRLQRNRNLGSGFLLLFGLGLGAYALRRLKAGDS